MPLTRLGVFNVRVYEHTGFSPSPTLNLLVGPNASGKTSLLEAISIVGTGRSFRTARIHKVIREGQASLVVTAQGVAGNEPYQVGIERSANSKTIHVDGRLATLPLLAEKTPIQAISPDTHFAFLSSSRQRRVVLDWGLFHVEPNYLPHWHDYQRALQQRNAALKSRMSKAVCIAWDQDLAEKGEIIRNLRDRYLFDIRERFTRFIEVLTGLSGAEILHKPGWGEESLANALSAGFDNDYRTGVTQSGVHRADMAITVGGEAMRERASHGQQKLLVIALRLAQADYFRAETKKSPVLLVDDLPAELDRAHRDRLVGLISKLGCQVFFTATDPNLIETSHWKEGAVFHVEPGKIIAAK